MNISSLLITTEDSGEQVIEGHKPIASIIEELQHSKVVQYFSYLGGIKLQVAIAKFKKAQAEDYAPHEYDLEHSWDETDPEAYLTEEEKSLIYAAYLMM